VYIYWYFFSRPKKLSDLRLSVQSTRQDRGLATRVWRGSSVPTCNLRTVSARNYLPAVRPKRRITLITSLKFEILVITCCK
jgi:hypothetical protein